jgi:L-rhamnose mutarotase
MSWTVDTIFSFQRWLINKNLSGGISSNDFFLAWNSEQSQYQSDLLGRFQRINNGKEGNNTGLIENETIMTKLSPFTIPTTLAVTAGIATKPLDYTYGLALRINNSKVYQVDHDQIWAILEDVIDPPSIADNSYYYTEYQNYFKLFPDTVTSLDLDYIASCKDIVWAYTFDTAGRQIYNESGITGLPVIFGGVGYTTPTITFSAPAAGGVQATGTLTVVGGVITAVVMTNVGNGYAGLTPTFTITGSSTTPANFGTPIVSVQPLWNNNSIIEITKRTLKSLGVRFTSQDFEQMGNNVINSGD